MRHGVAGIVLWLGVAGWAPQFLGADTSVLPGKSVDAWWPEFLDDSMVQLHNQAERYCHSKDTVQDGDNFARYFTRYSEALPHWTDLSPQLYVGLTLELQGWQISLDTSQFAQSVPNTVLWERLEGLYPASDEQVTFGQANPCTDELMGLCASIWNVRLRQDHGLSGLPLMGGESWVRAHEDSFVQGVLERATLGLWSTGMPRWCETVQQARRSDYTTDNRFRRVGWRMRDIARLGLVSAPYARQRQQEERLLALSGLDPVVLYYGDRQHDGTKTGMPISRVFVAVERVSSLVPRGENGWLSSRSDGATLGIRSWDLQRRFTHQQRNPATVRYTLPGGERLTGPLVGAATWDPEPVLRFWDGDMEQAQDQSAVLRLERHGYLAKRLGMYLDALPLRQYEGEQGFWIPVEQIPAFKRYLRGASVSWGWVPGDDGADVLRQLAADDQGFGRRVWYAKDGSPVRARVAYVARADWSSLLAWVTSPVYREAYVPPGLALASWLVPGLEDVARVVGQLCDAGVAWADAIRVASHRAGDSGAVARVLRELACDSILRDVPANAQTAGLPETGMAGGLRRLAQVLDSLDLSWSGFGVFLGPGPETRTLSRIGVHAVSPQALAGTFLTLLGASPIALRGGYTMVLGLADPEGQWQRTTWQVRFSLGQCAGSGACTPDAFGEGQNMLPLAQVDRDVKLGVYAGPDGGLRLVAVVPSRGDQPSGLVVVELAGPS